MTVVDETVWRHGCGRPCIEHGDLRADDPRACSPAPVGCTPQYQYVYAFACADWERLHPRRPDADREPDGLTYVFDDEPVPLMCLDDENDEVACFAPSADGPRARCPP